MRRLVTRGKLGKSTATRTGCYFGVYVAGTIVKSFPEVGKKILSLILLSRTSQKNVCKIKIIIP